MFIKSNRLQPNRPLIKFLICAVIALLVGGLSPTFARSGEWIPSLEAATIPQFSLAQLTRFADVIVVAKVVKVEPIREQSYVVTETVLQVESVLKGKKIQSLTIRQRGGQVEDLATVVPGVPYYTEGERVLVFLEAKSNGKFVTAGLWQGKHEITRNNGKDYLHDSLVFQTSDNAPPSLAPHDHDHGVNNPFITYDGEGEDGSLIPLTKITQRIRAILAASKEPTPQTKSKQTSKKEQKSPKTHQ